LLYRVISASNDLTLIDWDFRETVSFVDSRLPMFLKSSETLAAVEGAQNILFPESPRQYVFYYIPNVKENKKQKETGNVHVCIITRQFYY
jgi:hypothetical protein